MELLPKRQYLDSWQKLNTIQMILLWYHYYLYIQCNVYHVGEDQRDLRTNQKRFQRSTGVLRDTRSDKGEFHPNKEVMMKKMMRSKEVWMNWKKKMEVMMKTMMSAFLIH